MIQSRTKSRMNGKPRISNRLAALAATTLLLSSLAGPSLSPDKSLDTLQAVVPDAATDTLAEESISEMVGVSPPARAARSFKISSLIFRF